MAFRCICPLRLGFCLAWIFRLREAGFLIFSADPPCVGTFLGVEEDGLELDLEGGLIAVQSVSADQRNASGGLGGGRESAAVGQLARITRNQPSKKAATARGVLLFRSVVRGKRTTGRIVIRAFPALPRAEKRGVSRT